MKPERLSPPACLFLILTIVTPLSGQEIVRQKSIDKFACGPCAILNAINFADASLGLDSSRIEGETNETRVRTIIEQFGSRDSLVHADSKRFNGRYTGTAASDLVMIFNEILESTEHSLRVSGLYLNRRENESQAGNLARIHVMIKESIDQGLPVVFSVRAFTARFNEPKDKFLWEALTTHYVVIDRVQPELKDNEKGFAFEYLDSNSGQREYGYIHLGEARNFTAARGNAEHWKWIPDRPFCLVTAPSLRLGTQKQKFHLRTIITANYVIVPHQVVDDYRNRLFDTRVEVSCGQCQLDMEGTGCTLAVRHKDKSWYVTGTDIDAHGDAHAEDGFCSCIRHARVTGHISENKFHVEQFRLLPPVAKSDDQ